MMGVALSKKLHDGGNGRLMYWCPGCESAHCVWIEHPNNLRARWDWNGDAERPTFSPSILVRGVVPLTDEQIAAYRRGDGLPEPRPLACHSFVTDGRIQFLSDCTHALAGQTVDLPDWPNEGGTGFVLRNDPAGGHYPKMTRVFPKREK